MPGLAIGGAQDRKASVHGVAHRQSALIVPEREAVVERVGVLIDELRGPGRSAVRRLVDARVRPASDGEQVCHLVADALHVAELQRLSAGHNARVPMLAAVGADDESSARSAGPQFAVIRSGCIEILHRDRVQRVYRQAER